MNQGMDLFLSDINNNLKAIQSILEYLLLSIQKGVITLMVYYKKMNINKKCAYSSTKANNAHSRFDVRDPRFNI